MGRPSDKTIYEKIKKRIVTGEIPLGSRMSETMLAKELGVSRTPIRTCLTRLIGEGIAKMVPNDGVYVENPSRTDLLELLEIRMVLESHAASLAAQQATADELRQMTEACETQRDLIRELINRGEARLEQSAIEIFWHRLVAEVEVPFHTALVRASKNARLAATVANMQMLSKVFTGPYDAETIRIPNLCGTYVIHRRILRYIRDKNEVKAAETMRLHLRLGIESTAKGFDRIQKERRMKETFDNGWSNPFQR